MAQVPAAGDPFEALGDPNRREILRLLSGGDKPVREIAEAMTISRPAVSRHLRVLKDAGDGDGAGPWHTQDLSPAGAGDARRAGLS